MGKKNDYLALEESAQMLSKSPSWIKDMISRGELGAKLSGGRWLIAVRDLDKLRTNISPEPETVVHNFLPDDPPHKTLSQARGQHTANVGKPSAIGSGTSVEVVSNKKVPTRKQVGNKKARKRPKKAKLQRSERGRLARVGELEKGQRLYRQITAVERKIRAEISKCERAKKQAKVYDTRTLQLLISDFKDLKRRYASLRDPLGLLPSLVPTRSKGTAKKSTRKRNGAPPQTHNIHEQDSPSKSVEAKLQKTKSYDDVQKVSKKKRKTKRKFSNIVSINSTVPKSEVMNTYDPRRTLEVWEKPLTARKGKYQQPGERI